MGGWGVSRVRRVGCGAVNGKSMNTLLRPCWRVALQLHAANSHPGPPPGRWTLVCAGPDSVTSEGGDSCPGFGLKPLPNRRLGNL